MPYINIIIRHLVVVKLYEKEFDSVGFNPKDNITKEQVIVTLLKLNEII